MCELYDFENEQTISLQFYFGLALFITGMVGNIISDAILRNLRKRNQGYLVPTGFLFHHISCPNYFCEIIEWLGFVIASDFSKASVAFWLFTCANLLPRAKAHHSFYLSNFKDYPRARKAVIPLIW